MVKKRYWRLGTRTYNAWRAMKERCLNPRHKYFSYYGGAGIGFEPRWADFDNFLSDMGDAPHGAQIDRIDPNCGYTKENCRWVTPSENNANRRPWGKSGFKGVYTRPSGNFAAVLRVDGRTVTIGTFATPEEAARAFDSAIITRFGDYAMTNKRCGLI